MSEHHHSPLKRREEAGGEKKPQKKKRSSRQMILTSLDDNRETVFRRLAEVMRGSVEEKDGEIATCEADIATLAIVSLFNRRLENPQNLRAKNQLKPCG
jgi:hypothetical protein